MKKVILKPGKEKAIRNQHHWIFSGAISHLPAFEEGECLSVYSHCDHPLGIAYFNSKAKIIGRMLSFELTSPHIAIESNLKMAFELRKSFFDLELTNAYRLVNGEGDLLPGLIVDKYGDFLVLQVTTLGMEKLLPTIMDVLVKLCSPKSIYEKSSSPSRKEEGLPEKHGLLYGNPLPEQIEIIENGLKFLVSPKEGQKTGFFLDHREMRQQIRHLSKSKRVLNCFSYTGGFSVYAALGGALQVDSVDISEYAVGMAKKNMELNGFGSSHHHFHVKDVFQFLREHELSYDLIILDPPAFAKRQKDVIQACRGYKDINRIAMQKMPKGSILLTSSCSYFVDHELFQKVIFQASLEAKKIAKIIGRHQLAIDHPINICHPESDYLKSLLLHIN